MKKIIALIAFLSLIFIGCQSQNDKAYIDDLRMLDFNGDRLLYAENVDVLTRNLMVLMNQGTKVSEKDIKWELGEELDDGRMVVAEYRGDKVFYFTYERDNYIGINFTRSYTKSKFGLETTVSAVFPYENETMKNMLDY